MGKHTGERIAANRCPALGDLVAAADGGLSPSHKAAMTAHLRQCAACRDRLHQANAFLEASADVAPAGDAALGDVPVSVSVGAMAIGLDEIGSELDNAEKAEARLQEFTRRLHKQKQDVIHRQSVSRVRRWLPAAALIPLLIVGLTFSRMQTVVRAEELLSRASKFQRELPKDYSQRLRITLTEGMPAFAPLPSVAARPVVPRVRAFFAVRDVTGGVVSDAWIGGADANNAQAVLADVLARHGFELREPLSLSGVHAWRATPGEKHDEVFVSGDRRDQLVLRTTTTVGELREVEITVSRHDFHVVKLALAFEGIGRLEIAEIEDAATRRAAKAAAAAPLASSPLGMAADATPVPAPSGHSAASMARPPVEPLSGRPDGAQAGLSRWLDRTFGTRPERKTFVPDLRRLVGQVRQQIATLDTLARRYPETEVVEQWNGVDSAELHRRVDVAYGAISRDLNELDARMGILFGSKDRAIPVSDAPPDWRRRAALALTHAEAMDRDVRQLLTFDDVPSAEARAQDGTPVLSTFGALWDVVHAPAGGPESR